MRKKICFVVAVPETAISFLRDHIKALSSDYDVYLAGNIESEKEIEQLDITGFCSINIQRSISLKNDIKSVWNLRKYFVKMRFDAVHSVTPKAGLTTALAAWSAGIKHRIHIFTGQVWATKTGAMRTLLKFVDKVIATLNNHILVDGESQRQFLISEGVLSAKKSKVLGAGSICGANSERFAPIPGEKQRQRLLMKISEEKIVFAFMGRLNKEKGVFELLQAFDNMIVSRKDAFLVLFGPDEEGVLNHLRDYKNILPGENFLYYGRTSTPYLSLQVADVFCLPSYREGFGMSVVEASSLKLPVICSDAYGLANTMVDGETGLRCKVADVPSLEKVMNDLYDGPTLRKTMGENGRERVLNLFKGETIVAEWVKYYHNLLMD